LVDAHIESEHQRSPLAQSYPKRTQQTYARFDSYRRDMSHQIRHKQPMLEIHCHIARSDTSLLNVNGKFKTGMDSQALKLLS
jgi:hypothetical protein